MKKYKFHELALEITRRCNKKCAHCMRGDAQTLSMSRKIIDKVFDDVADTKYIALTGGEVLLEMDLIAYVVQKLKYSRWTTRVIEFTTNGIIRDRRIVDILEAFCGRKEGNAAIIRVSNDQFHNSEEYEQAYEFYTLLADEANNRIQSNNCSGGIFVEYTQDNGETIDSLVYCGNAVELIDNGKCSYTHGVNVIYPHTDKHRIRIDGDTIRCLIEILANGNVCFAEELSYKNLDTLALGNITNDSLSAIIENHNKACVTLCSETDILHGVCNRKYIRPAHDVPDSFIQVYGLICGRILELRKMCKELYPNVPTQIVIAQLPFPSEDQTAALVHEIYQNCPYRSDKLIEKILVPDKPNKLPLYQNALWQAVLTYLGDKTKRRYPYELFGNENDIIESPAFKKLRALDTFYKENPSEARNDGVFPCETCGMFYDIDYKMERPGNASWDYDKAIDIILDERKL